MSKAIRMVLYVLSILTVAGVILAFVISGGKPEDETAMTEANASEDEQKETEVNNSEIQQSPIENTENNDMGGTAPEGSGGVQTEEKEPEETTLIFTGDVLFANAFEAGYDANGISGVISDELREQLKEADILMINNEFPFSDRGTPMADKQFTFRSSPSYAKALQELGVDIVSLANNHTLDYGKDALTDTFETLDHLGILYAGAGDSVERAEELQVIEANGKKFGFLAVSRVIPTGDWKVENSAPGLFSCYDDTRLIELVEEAQEECDFLTVFAHWGGEYEAYPVSHQTKIAGRCVQAGADLIVGSHSHCLQSMEYMDGTPVFYSLGNFIFGRSIDRSAAVEVTIDKNGDVSYRLIPIYASGGVTQQMDASAAGSLYQYMQSISSNVLVDAEGKVTEKEN